MPWLTAQASYRGRGLTLQSWLESFALFCICKGSHFDVTMVTHHSVSPHATVCLAAPKMNKDREELQRTVVRMCLEQLMVPLYQQ